MAVSSQQKTRAVPVPCPVRGLEAPLVGVDIVRKIG
jgi:hypothetical protein